MEPKAITLLSERSTRSVWKEILIQSVTTSGIAIGLIILMAHKDWVIHYNKSIEIHVLPSLTAAAIFGILWTIRGTLGFLRSNDLISMRETNDPYLLDVLRAELESSSGPTDRLTRWTIAISLATVGYAFQAAPEAVDSIKTSIFTFWLPLMMYLGAAAYAFDITLFCLADVAIMALIWGISLLPVPLAIVVGAGIISFAIYKGLK